MSEPGWQEIARLTADDPHRYAAILLGPHGLFRFDAFRWRKYYEPSAEDDGPIDGGWWDCDHRSGLHETAETAEFEARRALPWLKGDEPQES